ncbi:hypothetical protein ACSTS3_19660 [Aquimarina muelleri]|uniref:hypothetical protein n=1 Tax=Aquimarina muelleri TaxID=279356 RepID=UPI003F686A54
MKKSYSKSELKEQSKEVFKHYPTAKVAFATTDGQFFLNENRANLHATAEGKVFKIENENVQEKEQALDVIKGNKNAVNSSDDAKAAKAAKMQKAKKEAKELAETIATLETVDAVNVAIKGKTAKSVLKAAAERIEVLTNQAANNTGEGNDSNGVSGDSKEE